MKIGSRIIHPDEAGLWDADILQISVYRRMNDHMETMKACVKKCRETSMPYVIHPVGYSILKAETFNDLKEMARWSDYSMILHDERRKDGGRMDGLYEAPFRELIEELGSLTDISFENAENTGDVHWFWDRYADSITLDIGHIESFGLDSVEFVSSLDKRFIEKINFVHLHHNNGIHGGITDHWPLREDCRELKALGKLVRRNSSVSVILELNETEEIGNNITLLKKLREKIT